MPPHMYRQVLHKALASEVRRQILLALRDKPLYLSEISQIVGKKPQTV
ncbi:helix-turn-helix domain-containing protein, partial [Candidatus Woesearchaeota archaeon]|nr:helix-turn-helix domain-containing protein [Candidatus Woesearchaeota archaeon]